MNEERKEELLDILASHKLSLSRCENDESAVEDLIKVSSSLCDILEEILSDDEEA